MLQPRLRIESVSGNMEFKMNFLRMRRLGFLAACCIIFSFNLISCQDLNLDSESIEVSRVKRDNVDENRDLTVLLVNNQKKLGDVPPRVGRYHSVKPLIGLLTSTARTFIQDGVTTEFATQILGTTLDNGRIYAQLLTKSSLVLYNKPSAVDNGELVKPTRMQAAFDGQWNVKQDLGFIDPDKFVLKNTDYISPSSKMDIVYASNVEDNLKYWSPPSGPDNVYDNRIEEPTGRRVQPVNEIPRYKQNEEYNMLDGPAIDVERKLVVNPTLLDSVNTLHRQSKAPETLINVLPETKDKFNDTNVVKVRPNLDLPTFTIKNEFSPIFYYIDNVESRNSVNQANLQTKVPKKLFGQKSEPKPKKTFTYAGFADFTTVVGDTVIVFSPNTEVNRINNPNEVNVYPSARPVDKMASKITHLASDIPLAKSTYKAHEAVKPSKILQMPKPVNKVLQPSKDDNRSDKALYNDRESLEKVLYEDDKMPDMINVQYNNGFDFNLDVIQPSEAVVTTPENTRLTDELGVIPINGLSSIATDPLKTLKPSATILEFPKGSIIKSKENPKQPDSSEETENTAAEIESEEDLITDSNDVTTTESSTSNETYEDEEFEPTTEGLPEQEVICTKGLETKSILTTAFKTLTYLTTYFIPLEGSELTSSIKSSVVVESDVGFSTKIACKSDIEPTAVISVNVVSSIHSSLEDTTEKSEENNISLSKEVLTESTTEKTVTTIQSEDDSVDNNFNPKEKEEHEDDSVDKNFNPKEKEEQKETTTERFKSTTKESVEVSISTEQTTTTTSTTEKPTTDKDDNKDLEIVVDQKENEVDVIYKTLYTTYTYLTTFFGDSATSVASHKSVVTNVITSTINLAEMDPELLGAFNEDEIAPTGVGIGRPTEAINSIIDLVKNKDVIESVEGNHAYSEQTPTPSLGDDIIASIKPDAIKTYLTTYTFFTTIYVGTDANVCSRSEVYTNYVGPDELIPTKVNPFENKNTRAQFDFRNCKQQKKNEEPDNAKVTSVENNISREDGDVKSVASQTKDSLPNPTPVEVDMLFSVESNPLETESAFVTDVKSSSSRGERKLIENNSVLDDQIVSESNIDEITPSPTLLLQTSYTTFTYYTTMYIGKDSSKVKSRLETLTNVVTETLLPKKQAEVEENVLPITYYTTFTYWTTLYKDKQTTITSREEIVSNVVTPTTQETPTVNPIDTTPIDVDTVLPPRDLEIELKPSLIDNPLESDDDKATFYTTYTYFTTFYVGNTSQIRSSLETVTNIVDNTKVIDDNRLGRKVQSGGVDKNLIQDDNKPKIVPSVVKEEIQQTKLPDISGAPPTVLLGTYIDNLFEVKSGEEESKSKTPTVDKKILYSEVAVISGDSTIISNANRTTQSESKSTNTTNSSESTPSNVIESSEGEVETSTENKSEFEEEDDESPKKKSRLSFTSKKPTFTPVIRPFASRNRPTFSPKRVPPIGSATTITRSDFTPTITATPSLKSARPAGFGSNRKVSAFPGSQSSRRFNGRSSISSLASGNAPSPSRAGSLSRNSIQPTSRRTGFRSSSLRNNVVDFSSRSVVPRIRPTPTVRLRGGRQSASVSPAPSDEQNQSETTITQQQQDGSTETNEEVTEAPIKTTSNIRFRRPLSRQPGITATTRSTTEATTRRTTPSRGRVSTTTRRTTTRTITNPILSLKRQRPNALFPRRNLFNKPEPEQQEIKNNEQEEEEESQEILEGDEGDNDYESSDRKEQQVATPSTSAPTKSPNTVKIKPFAFRRRTKRQADYGNRKYSNFRRPNGRALTPKPDLEPETEEPVTQRIRAPPGRYTSRPNSRSTTSSPVTRANARTPFIVRGSTTTPIPAYRGRRPSSRSSSTSTRPKAPRLQSYNSQSNSRSNARTSTSRTRTRGSTRANIRQRNSFENNSGERITPNHIVNDGKITVTHHIPSEVNIPVVMGKITEYKNVLTAKPSLEVILFNQLATSIGPLGNQQLLLPSEATELADNGATRIIKFLLHETPTTAVEFTPTTIRGRRTSYSHVIPSTVYNVERLASTLTPEINANVPLANLLLSQLLLGNGQQNVNPLLALQGQGNIFPQQPVVATPVTEYKTRSTTYVTTLTDNRETVLPITFKGVKILTTIKDPIVNVITATEFITDTLVSTPTVLAQSPNQFNSLLLPLLLQQQQQQQQQQAALALQTANPLLGLNQAGLNSVQMNLLNNDIYSNSPKENVLTDYSSNEEYIDDNQESEEDVPITPAPAPVKAKPKNKPKPHKAAPAKHTSIVTLYVSGRTPGEFSTVLSTLVTDETRTVNKREAIYYDNVKVLPSILPVFDDLTSSQYDNLLENSVVSDFEKVVENQKLFNLETESLESIVGELSKHINYDATPTYIVKLARPTKLRESEQYTLDDVS